MTATMLCDNAIRDFQRVRSRTEELCGPLLPDDLMVQSMPEVSPPKWHLGHTTWFFEELLLKSLTPGFRPFDHRFAYLFNSYYEALGPRIDRSRRNQLSRPGSEEVFRYRKETEERLCEALRSLSDPELSRILPVLELGLHHEQQHQELLLMDILHIFWSNPLRPAYRAAPETPQATSRPAPLAWIEGKPGVTAIGAGAEGFAFDNERPRHPVLLGDFRLASRLTTSSEYLGFIEDGGYVRPEFWLSDGWAAVQRNGWQAPLYWERIAGAWWTMTLSGMQPLALEAPVSHLSYYEADAFARWQGNRLPTEEEWESLAVAGTIRNEGLWEWTSSPYRAYPGYASLPGALGEYNGKFMCNQLVLRGGAAFAVPPEHLRPTYRNFYPPECRWQFSGLRLAA